MSDRYEALERLQRLRESGALSDAEFEAEKKRLLGHDGAALEVEAQPAPPVDAEHDVEVVETRRSRAPLWIAVAAVGIVLAIVGGLMFGRMVSGGGSAGGEAAANLGTADENAAVVDANLIQGEAPADPRSLPESEQLARAAEAAFSGRGAATVQVPASGAGDAGGAVRFTPGRLIWAPYGPVLISEGVADETHANPGRIAVHYLRPKGDRFEVARAFPSAVVTGSNGRVGDWRLSGRFSRWPVVYAEGGGTWQGYSCAWATLTELQPGGPVELATVPLSYDDGGAKEDDGGATRIDGKIINVVKDQSFDVVYSGSRAFAEHYVRSGNRYAPAGGRKSGMRTC